MLKFLVFSDTHYKKGMYRTGVQDIEKILRRAHEEGTEFVIHAGDFSNDYQGSPEFLNAYLNNPYNLPVYGVYGNHELEGGNTMEFVSAHLCNREVHFAEPVYNETTSGHWYTDIRGYRLIGLDTNFSFNHARGFRRWEHNTQLAPAKGNHVGDSLSPAQLNWLYDLIADAHAQEKKVIVVAHAGFTDLSFEWSPDAEHVRNIFSKFPGTVRLVMNGHYHTDHLAVRDGVCYFDVNTAINGCWSPQQEPHYAEDDAFEFTDYDADGNPVSTSTVAFNQLNQGWNTWSFSEPLSAVVTLDGSRISIRGMKTKWDAGVVPTKDTANLFWDGIKPEIEDREVEL